MPFSSAPLNRKMIGCWVETAIREITSKTSRATATLTPLSLAPKKKAFVNKYCGQFLKKQTWASMDTIKMCIDKQSFSIDICGIFGFDFYHHICK